jgi:formylglycine-generating enzyme required for sulfatase activity
VAITLVSECRTLRTQTRGIRILRWSSTPRFLSSAFRNWGNAGARAAAPDQASA